MVEFLGSSPNKAKKIGGKLGLIHPFAGRLGWRLREAILLRALFGGSVARHLAIDAKTTREVTFARTTPEEGP
jgi:hypothetical protein